MGCCSLINTERKTKCYYIGYLKLVKLILVIIYLVVTIAILNSKLHRVENEDMEYTFNDDEQLYKGFIVIIGSITLFLVFSLASTITLLVGLHKNNRGCVAAFLLFETFFTGLLVICIVVFSFLWDKAIVGTLIYIIVNIAYLLEIRKYYMEMDTEDMDTLFVERS